VIHDDVILKDLAILSKGKVKLEEETHLQNVKPITTGGFKEYETSRFSKSMKRVVLVARTKTRTIRTTVTIRTTSTSVSS